MYGGCVLLDHNLLVFISVGKTVIAQGKNIE